MPVDRILLSPYSSQRGWAKTLTSGSGANKDAMFINALFGISENTSARERRLYCEKRPGYSTGSTTDTNPVVATHYSNNFTNIYFANGDVYSSTTNIGTAAVPDTTLNYYVSSSVSDDVGVLAWVSSDNTGWYVWQDAITTNFPTFTGDTHTNTTIDGITTTTGIYKGQKLSGTGIVAGTRVLSVDSTTQITVDTATTATNSGVTITKEAISKIIDTDFPSDANSMETMGGRFFVGTDSGDIYESDLNDPSSWDPTKKVAADYEGDRISFIFKNGEYIIAVGKENTVQYFYNAGNPTGSILSSADHLDINGLNIVSRPVLHDTGRYFLARRSSNSQSGAGTSLCRFTGINSWTKISDDIVSSLIEDIGWSQLSVSIIGSKAIILIHGLSHSLIYDPDTNLFSILTLHGASASSEITSCFKKRLTLNNASTTDFQWSVAGNYLDGSTTVSLAVQTAPWDGGTSNRKTIHRLKLIADDESSGNASISWSDDDYDNFSTARTVDMTVVDKVLYRCGITRRRAFKVQHSNNTPFRAQALEIEYTINDK